MRRLARVLMLIGYIYGLVALMTVTGNGAGPIAIALATVTAFAVTLVHELGHLSVGLWAGHRVLTIAVYPIELSLRPTRLRWVPRQERLRLGGFVRFAAAPWRLRESIMMIAAGPAANAMLALSALAVVIFAGTTSIAGGEAVAVTAISGAMMVANLLPHGTSDGARLLGLRRRAYRSDVGRPA